MYGEGQGNGFEIRNGQLVPCERTLAEGFLDAIKRAEIKEKESGQLQGIETASDFLKRTPGTGEDTAAEAEDLGDIKTVEEFLERTPGIETDTGLDL